MKAHIVTPTPNIAKSVAFYESLNFSVTAFAERHIATDGKVIIEIDPNRFARAGVKILTEHLEEVATQLNEITPLITTQNGYMLSDPSGTMLYLSDEKPQFEIETNETAFSSLGNFAGLSLETTDPPTTMAIWKAVGFTKQSGNIDQGWVSLTNEYGLGVSIMKPNTCPHLFFNPSLTYFNGGNNLEVIEKVRKAKIPISEEITHFNTEGIVDNIIIRDPGGYGFFLFND